MISSISRFSSLLLPPRPAPPRLYEASRTRRNFGRRYIASERNSIPRGGELACSHVFCSRGGAHRGPRTFLGSEVDAKSRWELSKSFRPPLCSYFCRHPKFVSQISRPALAGASSTVKSCAYETSNKGRWQKAREHAFS